MPKFVEADNGLAASAALRGGDYLTRVIMHFAGMDPVVAWVPPPKMAEVIPAWMDEPVVMPAAFTAIGIPGCGKSDLGQLAARLQEESVFAAMLPPPQGLIHVDAPATPTPVTGQSVGLDSRAIYGHSADECILSARN